MENILQKNTDKLCSYLLYWFHLTPKPINHQNMRNTKKKAYIFMGTHENKKKNQEQSNIEQNLKREVKENLRNVEF